MNKTLNNIKHTIIFIGILSLFTLPQLNNVHLDPSPTFWGQVTFAWCSLALFIFIIFTHKKISLPFIIIPLSLFAIYICLQQYLVLITFVGLNYITALEMVICILLAIAVNSIITNYGIKTFTVYLTCALIIGAILQSAIGFIQYNNLFKYFGGIIFYDPTHPTINIFGHFGQRNHYCHFLTWAAFGLIYLYHQKIISKYFFIPLLLWFMFSMTIASSRSVFIYFGITNVITFIYFIVKKDKLAGRLFLLTIIASIFLLAFEYAYPIIQQHVDKVSQINSGLNRITDANGSEVGRRLVEWKKAFITFKKSWFVGAGLYGYAHNSVFLYKLFPNTPLNSGLFINCHNLILQLLAETGIIGGLIACFGIIFAIIRILLKANIETIIIMSMLGTTISHSMLEYPLWYLYFLGPFILFIAIDKPIFTINNKIIIGLSSLPIILLIYIMIVNSITFNKLIDYMDIPDDLDTFKLHATELQEIAQNDPLLDYHASFVLDNYIIPDSPYTAKTFNSKYTLEFDKKFTLFQPYPSNLIKLAKLEWNFGNKNYAKELVITAITAYPTYKYSLTYSLHSKKYKVLYNLANKIK